MAQHVQKFDRYGRPLPDDDGVIPDGGSVRVALPMMDHLPEEVRRALSLADGGTDIQGFIPGHRPGFMAPVDGGAAPRSTQARDRYVARLGDAWKNPPTGQPTQPLASSPRPNIQDAEQAYRAYVDRISNAWRTP